MDHIVIVPGPAPSQPSRVLIDLKIGVKVLVSLLLLLLFIIVLWYFLKKSHEEEPQPQLAKSV